MDRRCIGERGITMLEASIAILLLLSIILSAASAVERFQRGNRLEEMLEAAFYEQTIPQYFRNEAGDIEVNFSNLELSLEDVVNQFAKKLIDSGMSQENNYAIEGIVAEVQWVRGTAPLVKRLSVKSIGDVRGKPIGSRQLVERCLERMRSDESIRERFIRPDVIMDDSKGDNELSSSFALIILGASIELKINLLSAVTKISDSRLVRKSYNVLRAEL